jgi:hypothetical protein
MKTHEKIEMTWVVVRSSDTFLAVKVGPEFVFEDGSRFLVTLIFTPRNFYHYHVLRP